MAWCGIEIRCARAQVDKRGWAEGGGIARYGGDAAKRTQENSFPGSRGEKKGGMRSCERGMKEERVAACYSSCYRTLLIVLDDCGKPSQERQTIVPESARRSGRRTGEVQI